MKLDEFLDIHPLLRNSKEVEEQSSGRNFHFLHSMNPDTINTEILDSLDCTNSFWNIPDINTQHINFIDNWAYDRKFNNQYHFGFVDCLLELMWIRERMLTAKNMKSTKQNIFWNDIALKNKSHVIWLFNWCKDRPTVFLNIIHGNIQQLTENNESESVMFTLTDFMELEFRSWLCICEHEFLKLVHVILFEKVIDHNLIYDHDSVVCQELINSGILRINLAVFKLFIGDRNIFSFKKWENLDCTNLQTIL